MPKKKKGRRGTKIRGKGRRGSRVESAPSHVELERKKKGMHHEAASLRLFRIGEKKKKEKSVREVGYLGGGEIIPAVDALRLHAGGRKGKCVPSHFRTACKKKKE